MVRFDIHSVNNGATRLSDSKTNRWEYIMNKQRKSESSGQLKTNTRKINLFESRFNTLDKKIY